MFRKKFDLDKNSGLAERVLALTFPSALVFLMLVALKLLPPLMAIVSVATIIMFNLVFLFPLTFEMQQLKKYISNLAKGENVDEKALQVSEKEAKQIVEAVNKMHRFWAHKSDELEARCMSDTAVLDSLPDPIMMIDRAGNILGANLSCRQLFGKGITEKNVENVFDSSNFAEAVSRVLKKQSESENLIFYIQKPNEQKLYAHIKELPWLSRGKAVAVVSIYDLTKTMRVEKMQSDFVANASHELRTPLSIIAGFIETLQTTAKDDETARDHFLKIMAEQTDYMSSLIENLLSLSKIEMSQGTPPHEKVFVPKILEEVAHALELKAEARGMGIKQRVESGVTEIVADAGQVKQLVQNLADNAVKYGMGNTDVVLKAKMVDKIPPSKGVEVAEGKAIAISINNKGPKITPENMARLTERFYRLQEHKNLNIKGTGLGLAIAKQIIKRHKGNITVTSTAYNGTTFTIYLPVGTSESQKQ
ncbi:MAG: hypothetical protein LBL47_02675 [Lactobacillus sp.]|jgi:two-component system phosphate regulon sensor histidine kinase PhoR|nr:hypothetical protein [Lactobacillus sp.]